MPRPQEHPAPILTPAVPALIAIAKSAHPERWRVESMDEDEAAIWTRAEAGLLNGAQTEAQVCAIKTESTVERWGDYLEAGRDLRQRLAAEAAHAGFYDDDGGLHEVGVSFWGMDRALTILLTGVAMARPSAAADPVWRTLLIRAASSPSAAGAEGGAFKPDDALPAGASDDAETAWDRAAAASFITAKIEACRVGARVPGRDAFAKEMVKAVKGLKVNAARDLWGKHIRPLPNRKRGRPTAAAKNAPC